MLCGNEIDLINAEWSIRVMKKPVGVRVVFATEDGVCNTLEGDVSYHAGDAILTGVEGERWPIKRARFNETYTPILPIRAGENGTYTKKPIVVHALQMQEPFYVDVNWGSGRLEGKQGDWLLQYGKDDYGIVSQSIFEKTYQIIE